MARKNFEPSLAVAEDLLRLRWQPAGKPTRSHQYQPMNPGQWTAMAGLMQTRTARTLDLWEQAVAQKWSVSEGCAWVVHANRGDLVRPLSERFGVDWSVEIARLRAPQRGCDRPVSALQQALYQSDDRLVGEPENDRIRAPSVVQAWQELGLDPTQRLPTIVSIYAGMDTPVNTNVHLGLPWLGMALFCGAWETADRLMADPRVLADKAGLSQALYAWMVGAWSYNAPRDKDRNTVGKAPCEDASWPRRLLAAGADAFHFPWTPDQVRAEQMHFLKGERSTHTWAQSLPQYPWLTPDQRVALEAHCADAPLWSAAQWALRNAANRSYRQTVPLWDLLRTHPDPWAAMPPDAHGRTPMQIALAHRGGHDVSSTYVGSKPHEVANSKVKSPEPWQGERVMTMLAEAQPRRTQDELVTALYLGVDRNLWGPLRLITRVRQTHPSSVSPEGLFTDAELGRLIETLATTLYPVENASYRAVADAAENPTPGQAINPRANLLKRRSNAGTEHLDAWWKKEATGFIVWLAPHQQEAWLTWTQRMAESLPGARFKFPKPHKNQSTEEHDQEVKAYIEQRDLLATAATDEILQRSTHGFTPLAQATPVPRVRL